MVVRVIRAVVKYFSTITLDLLIIMALVLALISTLVVVKIRLSNNILSNKILYVYVTLFHNINLY